MAHGAPGEPGADIDYSQLVAALEAIRDYEPDEVAKDDFAYDRMVESYRDAARNGLAAAGMARLQHDVVTLPPDQQALGLVEALIEAADTRDIDYTAEWETIASHLGVKLGTTHGIAIRLKVLLEKQPAVLETLKKVDAVFAPNGVVLKNQHLLNSSAIAKATGERAIPYPLMIEVRAAIERAS